MSTKTAVVIDDEIDMTNYLSSILEEHDFEVFTATDGTSGETLIREKMPDVTLLDLMMPGRTGIQLFSKLRRDPKTKDLQIIMVTGIREELNIDWGSIVDNLKARKPDGFVEKPIDPDSLMRVVQSVVTGQTTTGEILHG